MLLRLRRNLSCLCALFLAACSTTPPDRIGVLEAKACMRALQTQPKMIDGYVIEACTNNGVWMVASENKDGIQVARYDFVNGEYAGPETGGGFVSVESLDEGIIQNFQQTRSELNKELKEKS